MTKEQVSVLYDLTLMPFLFRCCRKREKLEYSYTLKNKDKLDIMEVSLSKRNMTKEEKQIVQEKSMRTNAKNTKKETAKN